MDVKTAFLHGDLDRDIYMTQPQGFVEQNKPNHVCLLKKALYGLKQAPRQWNIKFDKCMRDIGFTRSNFDPCLYMKDVKSVPMFLLLYVDDMLLVSPSMKSILEVQKFLNRNFDMKNLGDAKCILGMHIVRDRANSTLLLNQTEYVKKILTRFKMANAKAVSSPLASHFLLTKDQCPKTDSELKNMESVPYAQAIGSVMYLMISTRPDLAYPISCLSRFMANPGKPHWEALKWLLRYLIQSMHYSLCFAKWENDIFVTGYVDSNYANDKDSRKSTTSYVFTVCGSCVSWKSQLPPVVALSTTESEFIAIAEASKEGIWFSGLMKELGFENEITI